MAALTFRHGCAPIMVDHTPSAALTAGDVAVVANIPYVAHVDIAADEKAAVGARNGVYAGEAQGVVAAGAKVYWNGTQLGANGDHFGFLTPDSSAAQQGDIIEAVHAPDGTTNP